jgi:DNA replication and repair protein RecF
MRIVRLQLFDYRNFHRLDLVLPPSPSVFTGDNAQGKSNLLEAVYLTATIKALRAESDAQLIRRDTLDDPLPTARVVVSVDTASGPLKVEVGISARTGPRGPIATKVARVNGVPKRLSDTVGRLAAVLFTADDLDLVTGSPSLRRRFIDLTLSQVEPTYAAARQRFDRVLLQRNHLLKRIRDGDGRPDELSFWDDELSKHGGLVFHSRAIALKELDRLAAETHVSLVPEESLRLTYRPRLDVGLDEPALDGPDAAGAAYADALRRGLARDIPAGMTLQGPHRDDLTFTLDDLPASGFASRAQQRTITLSLRLAEASFLRARRREPPILLLDDVLSEMDASRRRSVLDALGDYEQMIVTGTDLDRFPPRFLSAAQIFSVADGHVLPGVADVSSARTAES